MTSLLEARGIAVHGRLEPTDLDCASGELTAVIGTHNLQQAARVSDHTAFFYLGKLVEYEPTDVLFTRPREERTEAYVTGRFG